MLSSHIVIATENTSKGAFVADTTRNLTVGTGVVAVDAVDIKKEWR